MATAPPQLHAPQQLYHIMYPPPDQPQPIPLHGPATHPEGPPGPQAYGNPHPPPNPENMQQHQVYQPTAAELYSRSQQQQQGPPPEPGADGMPGGPGVNHYPSSNGVPRLPPILQVEKQQVTTSATQAASASRRRNEAHFVCPVPGCGSTFTRRFNLRGHLRSHTEERPYICDWPNCKKGFARQHDCKRHQALHTAKSQTNVCVGCKKTFSRLDALNRHLRSDGGADCRALRDQMQGQGGEENPGGDAQMPPQQQ
ncbi:hypothetical protein DFH07DRAFT_802243 [Mycena maculata]|uniref:C2H2-type domain-containing protein n=1 Tax=Mycena maculata TaxID=230809 RepID=A0AAD7JVJ1_9AGAR|nr:hypothetical protein DFH07DRAFT_802243 [Mycena maculata]